MIPSRNCTRTSTCRANKLGAQYSSTVVISDNHHSPFTIQQCSRAKWWWKGELVCLMSVLPFIWKLLVFANKRRMFANTVCSAVDLQITVACLQTLLLFANKFTFPVTTYMKTPFVCIWLHIESWVCGCLKTIVIVCKHFLRCFANTCWVFANSCPALLASSLQTNAFVCK